MSSSIILIFVYIRISNFLYFIFLDLNKFLNISLALLPILTILLLLALNLY